MKKQPQQLDDVFYLATDRVMVPVKEPYRIQERMIEMKNFVPEAFIIHQFQEYNDLEMECYDYIRVSKGDVLMPSHNSDLNRTPDPCLPFRGEDDDKDDDDWDDEDDDWDDDDEDWDEDDEDWDDEDEDEDWDDEDDEDWEDDDLDEDQDQK